MNPWDAWDRLRRQERVTVCGLMSGTSADGIDVAVVEFSGGLDDLVARVLRTGEGHYPDWIKEQIRSPQQLDVSTLSLLNVQIAREFAMAAESVGLSGVDLVASHGQTVFHHSAESAAKSTLQIGCGDVLAAELGFPVVFNFRAKEIAMEGEGAPLTPASDYYLYRNVVGEGGALVNLGGIANITVFGPTLDQTIGFDTGPANCILDRIVPMWGDKSRAFDDGGQIASGGKVYDKLLEHMLHFDRDYLDKAPPKSTGIESYGWDFIDTWRGIGYKVNRDFIATMTAYSAECIARGLRFTPGVKRLVLAGGGRKNDFLVNQIRERTGLEVLLSEDVGIPGDSREAIGFALFGYLYARGLAIDLSGITGSRAPILLGQLSLP